MEDPLKYMEDMNDVKEQYKLAYLEYSTGVECGMSKYEWAASEIFGLVTYDGDLDKLFVERICDVCKYIAAGKTFEFINMSEENYITFILVCQVLYKKNWINWGTSIRGAWFDDGCGDYILDWWVEYCNGRRVDFKIPFNTENLLLLIEFLEEPEKSSEENLKELIDIYEKR